MNSNDELFDLTQESSASSSSSGKSASKRIRSCESLGSLEEKSKKKSKTAAERQAEKQKKAEERAARRAILESNKIYKPGECMKHMSIEVHPALGGAWYMADVAREAAAAGCRVSHATDLCDPALVMWTRAVQPTLAVEDGQVGLTSPSERCSRALYVCQAQEVAAHVHSRSLSAHVAAARDMAGCALTLAVFGARDYFKSNGRKTSNSNPKLMTEIEFEMAITDLLVTANCDTVLVNTPNELALTIVQFTKAIAEEPYKKAKRACEEQAEFYMKGDNKKCVALDKDGNGVSRLWQQMIAVLPHSSLETARAVCAEYKTPQHLYQALQAPDSIHSLASMGVSRAGAPGARARRLGPEFARKLHALFTTEDGDFVLD